MAVDKGLHQAAQDLQRALAALRLGIDLLQAASSRVDSLEIDADAILRALHAAVERAVEAEATITAALHAGSTRGMNPMPPTPRLEFTERH